MFSLVRWLALWIAERVVRKALAIWVRLSPFWTMISMVVVLLVEGEDGLEEEVEALVEVLVGGVVSVGG
jgi:hypothetical protein